MRPKLLIVDDDEEIQTQMRWALANEYDILTASDRTTAIETFRLHRPGVVLLDLGLPPRPAAADEGLAALPEFLAIEASVKVVVVSGQNEKEVALKAVGIGAYDYLCKPISMDELRLILRRCFHVARLEREFRVMQSQTRVPSFEDMLGTSPSMHAVFESIRKVATTNAPVLLRGESGTGKEMAARAIHQRSDRREGPFVAINCSAIPSSLLESELFGHEKGAFTGAHMQRKGRFEQAAGGTLFLDEIGEVPLAVQVKLLRFLQDQCIERVGGRGEIEVDARIVAATNADLQRGMTTGTFREDLYYRLAVVQIMLPPLRERGADVLLLAQSFLQQFAAQNRKPRLNFGADAARAIQAHAWPGNVRELQNRIRRAVIMGVGPQLTADDLELAQVAAAPRASSLREARELLERDMVREALRKHSWKITAAAVELGVSRPTLYELMDKLGIEKAQAEQA